MDQGNILSTVNTLTLKKEMTLEVSCLDGFKKGNKPPKWYSDATKKWVEEISRNNIARDIEEMREKILAVFGDKDVLIQCDASGEIKTRYFDYYSYIYQNKEKYTTATWEFSVSSIKEKNVIDRKEFNELFGKFFDKGVHCWKRPELGPGDTILSVQKHRTEEIFNIAEIVKAQSEFFTVEVINSDNKSFRVGFPKPEGKILFSENAATFEFSKKQAAKDVVEIYLQFLHLLKSTLSPDVLRIFGLTNSL